MAAPIPPIVWALKKDVDLLKKDVENLREKVNSLVIGLADGPVSDGRITMADQPVHPQ